MSVTLRTDEAVLRTTEVLRRSGLDPAPAPGDEDGLVLVVPVRDSTEIATVVRATDEAGAEIAGLAYAEPTLDDVYMALNHSSAVR